MKRGIYTWTFHGHQTVFIFYERNIKGDEKMQQWQILPFKNAEMKQGKPIFSHFFLQTRSWNILMQDKVKLTLHKGSKNVRMQIQYIFILHPGSKIKNKTTKVHLQSQPPFFITTDLRTRRKNAKSSFPRECWCRAVPGAHPELGLSFLLSWCDHFLPALLKKHFCVLLIWLGWLPALRWMMGRFLWKFVQAKFRCSD